MKLLSLERLRLLPVQEERRRSIARCGLDLQLRWESRQQYTERLIDAVRSFNQRM